MKLVLQKGIGQDDVISAVNSLPHVQVAVTLFSNEIISDTELFGTDFIPYGSTALVKTAYRRGWKGVHFNPETFNYETCSMNRSDMLNSGNIMLINSALAFLERQHEKSLWFVRPSLDLKKFSGRIDSPSAIHRFLTEHMHAESSSCERLNANTSIVLAQPVRIFDEARYFIIDSKVVCGSMYRKNGHLTSVLLDEIPKEVQEMASGWLPDECCVMDVASTEDGYKVIEFNCINCAGLYACPPYLVFSSLLRYDLQQNCK